VCESEEPSRRRKKGRRRRGREEDGPTGTGPFAVTRLLKIVAFFRIDFFSYFGLILDFLALFLACIPDYLLSFVEEENRFLAFPPFSHAKVNAFFLFCL
jgi:hypothetical protein